LLSTYAETSSAGSSTRCSSAEGRTARYGTAAAAAAAEVWGLWALWSRLRASSSAGRGSSNVRGSRRGGSVPRSPGPPARPAGSRHWGRRLRVRHTRRSTVPRPPRTRPLAAAPPAGTAASGWNGVRGVTTFGGVFSGKSSASQQPNGTQLVYTTQPSGLSRCPRSRVLPIKLGCESLSALSCSTVRSLSIKPIN